MINLLIARINQVCRNDKEKDILSLVYITWFVLYILIIMIPLILEGVSKIIENIFDTYYQNIIKKEVALNILDISVFNISDIIKIILVALIPVISRKILKKSNFKNELVAIVISILGIVIIFNNYILFLIIFLALILIIYVVPLGKAKYINFIINIKYLKEVVENYFHKNNEALNNKIYKKVYRCVIILAVIVLIARLLSYYMSMSFIFMLIIVISLVCLLYLYRETRDEIMTVCKKIIIFVVFLYISLYANRGITNNLEKILLSLTTIYFSFDRIISLGKDIKDIIKKYSITYYIENEYLTIKDIKNEYLDMKFIDYYEIEEYELVKQIILRQRLFLIDELKKLCSLYLANEYKCYKQFVKYNLHIINLNSKEKINLNDEEREFEKMINIENQKIYPIELYKEYANILYARGKYNEALKIYEQFIVYLNKNELNMICECYSKLGKNKRANHIKKNYIDLRN